MPSSRDTCVSKGLVNSLVVWSFWLWGGVENQSEKHSENQSEKHSDLYAEFFYVLVLR